jgi:hypothetical protein
MLRNACPIVSIIRLLVEELEVRFTSQGFWHFTSKLDMVPSQRYVCRLKYDQSILLKVSRMFQLRGRNSGVNEQKRTF